MDRRFLLLLMLVSAAVGVGCEESFDPFEESDVAFSVFGYVDAAADTQFVRVTSLRQSAYEEAPVDAVVTLENLTRGDAATLRDSVFLVGGAFVHNFWTDTEIESGSSYRLTIAPPEGGAATAQFETPPQFPDPELESGLSEYSSAEFPPTAQSMTFVGVEKLAELRVTYVLEEPATTVTISYLDRVRYGLEGRLTVALNAYTDVQAAVGGAEESFCPSLRSARVFVAVATNAWPDLLDLDSETLALPATASNVEGGIGYVGGVITRSGSWPELRAVFGYNQAGCL